MVKLAKSDLPQRLRTGVSRGTRVRAVEDVFCASTAERPYHSHMIAWKSCYCKREFDEFLLVRFNSAPCQLTHSVTLNVLTASVSCGCAHTTYNRASSYRRSRQLDANVRPRPSTSPAPRDPLPMTANRAV